MKPSHINLVIQSNKDKSYDPDFTTKDGGRIHVKSQSLKSKELYGCSYLIQKSDPLVSNPKDEDLIVLTVCNIELCEVDILDIYSMKTIFMSNAIGETKLEHLRKSKVAIYYDDLKAMKEEVFKGLVDLCPIDLSGYDE